jgi:hypothetical protein
MDAMRRPPRDLQEVINMAKSDWPESPKAKREDRAAERAEADRPVPFPLSDALAREGNAQPRRADGTAPGPVSRGIDTGISLIYAAFWAFMTLLCLYGVYVFYRTGETGWMLVSGASAFVTGRWAINSLRS